MKLRNPLLIRLTALLVASVLRLLLSTVRIRVRTQDHRTHPTDPSTERFIYIFWHESLLTPAKIKTRIKALISRSADGELIAQICQHLKIGVIRGSTSRGGVQALLEMTRASTDSHLAITPDGLRGPRRKLQAGAVFLASHTGLSIVPVGVGFTRAWRAKSWDRFAVPRPLSTVVGVVGQPIAIPPDLGGERLETYRQAVEQAMLGVTEAAEHWADELAGKDAGDVRLDKPSGPQARRVAAQASYGKETCDAA